MNICGNRRFLRMIIEKSSLKIIQIENDNAKVDIQ